MKKLLILPIAFCCFTATKAQLSITPNQTASQLANILVASSSTNGVTISNEALTCHTFANGEFSGITNLGINNGILLGTGNVLTNGTDIGFNGLPSNFSSSSLSTAGDADLGIIVGANTFDACVLEFDLVPVGTYVEFEYVFGSDEYPAFNCSPFNDIFGFFISGPGITGSENMALIPNTSIPVSINSINDGSNTACTPNTALYVNNVDTFITVNGFTTPLIATHTVVGGQTYHLKMAITDVADGVMNSYVALKANSLKSGGTAPNGLANLSQSDAGITIYPTTVDDILSIQNGKNEAWEISINSVDGKVVYKANMEKNESKATVNLSHLAKGVFLVKMTRSADQKNYIEKLIKL